MYPFSMLGRVVQIHRFSVTYTEPAMELQEDGTYKEVERARVEYCHTQEQADTVAQRTSGKIVVLDSSGYEWMDGIKVPDVPDTYGEAVKLYDLGAEAWLTQAQARRQEENNAALAAYLSSHPITWTDGKRYCVTQQDQQEIALNLTQYQLSTAAGLPAKLEWHAIHEECREFSQEELSGLALAISQYVYPLVRKNQAYKTRIYGASTAAELEGMVFSYEETV